MPQHRTGFFRRLLLTMVVFLLLMLSASVVISRMEAASRRESLTIVSDSIRHALLTCYAVQGGYPDSLDYLKEHYGLSYDSNAIHVYYDAFASNIMPDFRVTLRGDGLP